MKVYTKVTSGMEMKMARGRFLGATVECISVSPLGAGSGAQGGGGGPGVPAMGAALSLLLLHPLGDLVQGRGQHCCLFTPRPNPSLGIGW